MKKVSKKNMLLVLVLTQLALLSGCTGPAGGAPASPTEQVSPTETFPGGPRFVRISRAFFEKQLRGTIVITQQGGEKLVDNESLIEYRELEPYDPAPTGDYIADFRDRPGCAFYQDRNGVRLCFRIAPDVSSVDVKEEKVSLEGLETMIANELPECAGGVSGLKFVSTAKGEDSLEINFSAEAAGSCPNPGAWEIKVTLKA